MNGIVFKRINHGVVCWKLICMLGFNLLGQAQANNPT